MHPEISKCIKSRGKMEEPMWLKNPLAPLSESILMSGLVSSSNAPRVRQATTNNQSNTRVRNTGPDTKTLNRESKSMISKSHIVKKLTPLKSPENDLMPCLSQQTSNFQFCTKTPSPMSPIQLSKNVTSRMGSSFNQLGDLKTRSEREELRDLTNELDAALAQIAEEALNKDSVKAKIEISTKQLGVYNFTFNKLVLQEKKILEERALLYKRVQQYYLGLIEILPTLHDQIDSQMRSYIDEIEEHKEKNEILIKEVDQYKIELADLASKVLQGKEDLELLTRDSNEKDVKLQALQFDLDYASGQAHQAQFKIQSKKEKIKNLKEALARSDAESKKQLKQIDEADELIKKYQDQDTGYIHKFNEEVMKNKELMVEMQKVKDELNALKNIPKNDIAIDTEDLPVEKKKKNKSKKLSPSRSKTNLLSQTGHDSIAPLETIKNPGFKPEPFHKKPTRSRSKSIYLSNRASSQSSQNSSDEETRSIKSIKSDLSLMDLATTSFIDKKEYTETEVQTDPIEIAEPNQLDDDDVDINEIIPVSQVTYKETTENAVTNCQLDSIPDILPLLIGILGQQYVSPNPNPELHVFSIDQYFNVVKKPKPLFWGLSLINEFLTDTFLLSSHNDKHSVEPILMDWLNVKYKLPHLVTQVAADFSLFMTQYTEVDEFVHFFFEVLSGVFNVTQIIYIATIYSFTIPYSIPRFDEVAKSGGANEMKIHIKIVNKVIERSFNQDIADGFTNLRSNPEDPMINYLQFLRDVGNYFGQKHRLLSSQTKNLLILCGSTDSKNVYYDPFCNFCLFLNLDINFKHVWTKIKQKSNEKSSNPCISIAELIAYCADKRQPMMDILSMDPLDHTVQKLLSYPDLLQTVFHNFRTRFTSRITNTIVKLPKTIKDRSQCYITKLKESILSADIPRILFDYRMLITKIDRLMLKEKNYIPFPAQPTIAIINNIMEYFDRTESVAFAFIE